MCQFYYQLYQGHTWIKAVNMYLVESIIFNIVGSNANFRCNAALKSTIELNRGSADPSPLLGLKNSYRG